MSYDLRFCLPKPGRSPEEIATSDIIDAPAMTPEGANRIERLLTALRAANPRFEVFRDAGHVELASLSPPIQIGLYPEEASISAPYGGNAAGAQAVVHEIADYARILVKEGGYFAYDPQLDRVLDLDTDFAADGAAVFADTVEKVGLVEGQPRRPWWKFW